MKRWLIAGLAALGVLASASASARVDIGVNIGVPGPYYYGGPVYRPAPPVYYAPAPVYYPPAVVYETPRYYRPGPPPPPYWRGYGHGRDHWRGDHRGGRGDWHGRRGRD